MSRNLIITIGRQIGSGGCNIGKDLAKRFGISYYDKELINEAVKYSGLQKEVFERSDEKDTFSIPNIFSTNWLSFDSGTAGDGVLSTENIFKSQADTIEMLSKKEECVIVGRCADYILRNNPNCINLFIHAPFEERVKRISSKDKISKKDAAAIILKNDKYRAAYYNFYTDKQWGDSNSYHLSVDSSILGMEETAEAISQFIIKVSSRQH